ncbi:MAG TPA: DUF1697 domain-containing protein [Candidatus Saccharimonadales bacterium]|jgi:uncharacterized protein (DUF1697 family)|nr:DUF1697 domain-containing protein [Candidatus Saccharimonadales bacterium]
MKYVALLRGINVGGKSMVSMQELRGTIERAGMSNVSTYINSGNIICESDLPRAVVTNTIEQAIEQKFGFAIHVVVLDRDRLLAIARALPKDWTNDAHMKCDVMFLWEHVDSPDVLKQVTLKPGIDHAHYVPGAILWAVDRDAVARSGLLRLIGTELYKHMTVRNCNTVRKLATLVKN